MSGILLNSLYIAEPLLMVVVMFALLRSKDRKRFRALFAYCTLRLTSILVLQGLYQACNAFGIPHTAWYPYYFYLFWSFYIAGAIAVFFVILELFKFALEPLPGLRRLGLVAFRWVACVSCIAAVATVVTPGMKGTQLLLNSCDQLMRCESIFLLSLLFFLMISATKLGLSYRSRVFGVSFGFGVMAVSNLIASAVMLNYGQNAKMSSSAISIVDTSASLLTLVIWSAYFLHREPARNVVSLPVVSPLARWNEIAMALGANARTATATPSSDFFLQDVEKVVDRILSKNSLDVAS